MTFEQASYDGRPTYELAEEAKHNPEVCVACCEAELRAFEANGHGLAPAPYFFVRAAVLFSKAKDWEAVAYWAETYLDALELYRQRLQQLGQQGAKVWLGPQAERLRNYLEKAQLKLQ